jgi:hypothetical protein
MFSLNPSYNKLCVLFPKDLDIKSIQKCPIDFNCEFAPLEDKATIDGLGPSSNFVIFQKDYFIAHVAGHEIKCDYNCRNRVMTDVFKWRSLEPPLDEDREFLYSYLVRSNELINDIVHNNELPHMIFSNESLPCDVNYLTNSIMEPYISVDIQTFAEITKSKPCNHDSFVVHFVDENLQDRKRKPFPNHQFICCNMKTLETYEYRSVIKYRVMEILCVKSDDPFVQLKSEYEQLKSIKPLPRFSDFHLKDIEGQPVLENTDYHLEMCDQDEDVLGMHDAKLYATYYRNRTDPIVVQCYIIDGIFYLVRKNKYLHVADGRDKMSFTDQFPIKHQRLQFQVTNKNTFKTVQWNQLNYLTTFSPTTNYTNLMLKEGNDDHLELYLKRL